MTKNTKIKHREYYSCVLRQKKSRLLRKSIKKEDKEEYSLS